MKYDRSLREEALKNKVAEDFFPKFDCTNILGNVDFSVCVKDDTPTLFDNEFLLWGEAKRGAVADFRTSFAQLILTIGKEKTFDRYLPPQWLCEFDAAQIAFIPYSEILALFYENDFNWNVTPSDHDTREFRALYDRVKGILDNGSYVFSFDEDERLLREFIKANLKVGKRDVSKRRITKNNFISIYNRWLTEVKPSIAVNWAALKRKGILDSDFYLADIMSKDNAPIMQKLHVLLVQTKYVLDQHVDETGLFSSKTATFNDEGVAHARFWIKYERPPKKEYQEFIIARRDLLVPQDVRERKGSYFTPQKWVELSQRYLEMELGEDWQQEYYVWDCAAGTGNLLVGLQDKYRIWASTLDQADVDVMKERARNGANLLESHIFQFDFLNDGFEKLPAGLREIIEDPERRKRLVIYINGPYKESGNRKQTAGTGSNVAGVSKNTMVWSKYGKMVGSAINELFAQFTIRIAKELCGCVLAEFSTLKILQGPNFSQFRKVMGMELKSLFIVPGETFDNVKGSFPIGFHVWKTGVEDAVFDRINASVFTWDKIEDHDPVYCGEKTVLGYDGRSMINAWISPALSPKSLNASLAAGYLQCDANDFQHQNYITIYSAQRSAHCNRPFVKESVIRAVVYHAVRKIPKATWLNDRDQFLAPDESWGRDRSFQMDCLVWSLFNNSVRSADGPNLWIPYTEPEVGARDAFRSHFISDYMKGFLRGHAGDGGRELFDEGQPEPGIMVLSPGAALVMERGRLLWSYYHQREDADVNASFYDIRECFQGRNEKGVMNATSEDHVYVELLAGLNDALKALAEKIEPKIYEHGFLIR